MRIIARNSLRQSVRIPVSLWEFQKVIVCLSCVTNTCIYVHGTRKLRYGGPFPTGIKRAGLQYTISYAKQAFKIVLHFPLVEKNYFEMQEQH